MVRARIIRSSKRVFDCQIVGSDTIVQAAALRELIKGRDNHIVVGDYVELKESEEAHTIVSVEERSSEIWRVIPREQRRKVTAANCDYLVIVMSVSRPEFKRGLLDRYLLRGVQWDIPTLVLFNKMDEFPEGELDLSFESARIEGLGIECFEVSATEDSIEARFGLPTLESFREKLKGKTAIFMGQSGVGKSKLITRISDGKVELESRNLAKVGKGSHTTTWSEIVDCGEFTLIDSPGIRSFAVDDIFREDLERFFPDIFPIMAKCKFRNCDHTPETKGCAFYSDDLVGQEREIALSRLDSFLRVRQEILSRPEWKKT